MEYRNDYIEFLNLLGFSEEDRKILINSFDAVMTHPAAVAKIYPFIENYKNGAWLDYFTYMGQYEQVLETVCTNKLTDGLMFHLVMAAYSYPFFEKNGFSREVWLRSMKDFTFKNEECKTKFSAPSLTGLAVGTAVTAPPSEDFSLRATLLTSTWRTRSFPSSRATI